MTTKTDEQRKEAQRKRKEAQRKRDKKPGGKFEKTYRATRTEHKALVKYLKQLRESI